MSETTFDMYILIQVHTYMNACFCETGEETESKGIQFSQYSAVAIILSLLTGCFTLAGMAAILWLCPGKC